MTKTSKKKYTRKGKKNYPSYAEKKKSILKDMTENFIEMLEKGNELLPWRKPWSSKYGQLAQNLVYKNPYKGINLIRLMDELNPFFITFYQLKQFQKDFPEAKLQKNSTSRRLVAYNVTYKHKDGSKVERKDGVFYYLNGSKVPNQKDVKTQSFISQKCVYSLEDIVGLDHLLPELSEEQKAKFLKERIPICEDFIKEAQADKRIPEIVDGSKAYYRPSTHMITMPKHKHFDSNDTYYSTLFHESIHSTGPMFKRVMGLKGTPEYAKEELVAELGASLMCALFGIDNNYLIENQAAYLKSWLSGLRDKENDEYILTAANAASKAANYLIGDFLDKRKVETDEN